MGFSAAVNDAKVSGPVPSPGSGPGARDAAGSRTGTGKDKESRRIQVTTAIYAREDSASHLVDDSGDDDDDDGDDGESVRKLV